MSESDRPSDDLIGRYLAPGGDNVKLVYVLYLASFVTGLTLLVGVVMAYLNRSAVTGTWAESHYEYLIRTFWIGLVYVFIAVVLMLVAVGFLLMFAVAIWGIVRCVRGLQWAAREEPVPNPATWAV